MIFCINTIASAQIIHATPGSLSFTAAVGSSSACQADTISGSSLSPSSGGHLTVTAPVDFLVSVDSITWVTSFNLNFTSSRLPATPIFVQFDPATTTAYTGTITIEGGGAPVAEICVCGNAPSCSCITTSVYPEASMPSLSVLPNPAHDNITITSTDKIMSISIANLLGQVVYNGHCNTEKEQVDLSLLPAGVYYMRINGSVVRKFLKE